MAKTSAFNYSLKGMNELMARLLELKEDVGKKVVYGAASAMARVVKKAAIENATTAGLNDSGSLISNIALARSKTFTPPLVMYEVGVRHGTKKQIREDNDPFYWWFWEFGHMNPMTNQFERRPFLVPAFENNRAEALEAAEKVIARAIKRVEAKAKTT
jgi:HK97 gp10 family phage protein